MQLKKLFDKSQYIHIGIFLLCFVLYFIPLFQFDFYSDDFGYFLNFRNQTLNGTQLSQILTSYLTGGVPRLQIGWHIVHQLLFMIFGIKVFWYFFVQWVLLTINSYLIFNFFKSYIGDRVAFISVCFIIVNPYYLESFYWISANYAFFQIFFLLSSFIVFQKAIHSVHLFKKTFLLLISSISLVCSLTFQEQAFPFLVGAGILLFLLNFKKLDIKSNLLFSCSYTILNILLLFLLFVPQLFLIKSGSSTSLLDTFNMYYPSPLISALKNIKIIFKQMMMFGWPDSEVWQFFFSEFNTLDFYSKSILILQIILFSLFGFIFIKSIQILKQPSVSHWNRYQILSLIGWGLGAMLVVLPIQYYMGRYTYFILVPFAVLISIGVDYFLNKFKYLDFVIVILLLVSSGTQFFTLQGHYFPLVNLDKKSINPVLEKLRSDKKIKAIVLSDFPPVNGVATSGAFLNYHAVEWWLRWKSLPNDIGSYVVANEAFPCKTENSSDGFRMVFGDYPLERLQKCFSKDEVLFVSLNKDWKRNGIQIHFSKKEEFKLQITEKIIVSNEKAFELRLPEKFDLRYCQARMIVDAKALGYGILNGRLYSEDAQVTERLVFNSDGESLGSSQYFAQERITGKGPYKIIFTVNPSLYNSIKSNE